LVNRVTPVVARFFFVAMPSNRDVTDKDAVKAVAAAYPEARCAL
jgi:hypothetical protein